MSNSEYREAQQQARDHGLKARQEARLENATYTAAEVKVLTETASKVAYALGRKDAGEEIALALEAIPATVYPEDIFPPDGTSVDAQSAKVMRFAYPAAARIAREVVSEEPQDASEPRIDPSMGMDLPPEPQAVKEAP